MITSALTSSNHTGTLIPPAAYEIPIYHSRPRGACRHFLRDGTAFLPHQRRANWQAGRPAQAGRGLVEARTFTARGRRRAGKSAAADDISVSQRHSHRPLEHQQWQKGQLHTTGGIQHSREEGDALLEIV